MTHLEAANASFSQARSAMKAGEYNTAAQLFNHAKEMFQHHEHNTRDNRRLADHAARWVRTAIQKRDRAAA